MSTVTDPSVADLQRMIISGMQPAAVRALGPDRALENTAMEIWLLYHQVIMQKHELITRQDNLVQDQHSQLVTMVKELAKLEVPKDLLRDMIQLCHPDRHPPQRRAMANRATVKLLELLELQP